MDIFRINFKIAFRNLRKSFVATCINIGGIAIAIMAFIIIILYIQYENGYDGGNANRDNIYLVGRDLPNNISNFTSAEFAKSIKENCPEVDYVGKVKFTNFEFALSNKRARFYMKNVLSADYEAYKIFGFHINDQSFKPKAHGARSFFLREGDYDLLFPGYNHFRSEMVGIGNKAFGQTAMIDGIFSPEMHSNLVFDGLAIADDISFGTDSAEQSYMTFIQVKPNTNIKNLENKVNGIYKMVASKNILESKSWGNKHMLIYLDPLKNMHLQAKNEPGDHKIIIKGVLYLGFLVLILGCVSSVNMNISQSTSRAKEIGIKKIMGASRNGLAWQFIFEIFFQCSVAAILGVLLVEVLLPTVNNVMEVKLSLWNPGNTIFWLIPLTLIVTTVLTGIYPAMVLSAYKPMAILKGSFEKSFEGQWVKKTFLVFQFSIAMCFIISLLIVRAQLNYMQMQDRGFTADQVLYIRNISIFDKEETFIPVKQKILKINGVRSVSVASNIPTSPKASVQIFQVDGAENYFSVVNVGSDYFETLDIKLSDGRLFSNKFESDTSANVILNETAVRKYRIANPVGKLIRGCNTSFKIVGIIKDFKSEGAEKAVEPTIYSFKKTCGDTKNAILVKLDQRRAPEVISALKANWANINKLDGEDFRYDFMDNLYKDLFKKQERLRFIITYLSALTIIIASFGIYAYARFMINSKKKEIAVRRILGANDFQILKLMNSHFIWLVIISNAIAMAVVYVAASKWLENFAFKKEITPFPFILTSAATTILIICTVCHHAYRAMKAIPAHVLKSD